MRAFLAVSIIALLSGCADLGTTRASTATIAPDSPIAPAASGYCVDHTLERHSGQSIGQRRAAMEAELQDFLRLAEEALSMRAGAIRLYQDLKAKTSRGLPLSGEDLKRLNEGSASLLAQRSALMKVAEAHECWISPPAAGDTKEAGIRAAGVAMSLSAALILYDNYLSAIAPFRQDHELRQHLNRSDRGFGLQAGTLNEIAISFASVENRQRTRRAVEWVEMHAQSHTPEPFEQYAYLLRSIEQSPSLQLVRQVNPLRDLGSNLDFLGSTTVDTLFTLKNESTNLSSLLFGNTIGLVEMRRGKLYGRPEVARRVGENLKAGDILVEKTPFRLTDAFIPGHWGHAAIWAGSESELRALGIWEHPAVRPHQESIRAGRAVVEALRSGVQMNTIDRFMNVDDLALLRHERQSKDQLAEVILQTLRQVGKAYDFNFDAETTHRVFCSKLVYLAYGDLKWPTSRVLGRVTVSPDNVAALATGNGPLNVSLLYHDGEEIVEQPRRAMDALIQSERLALARRERAREVADLTDTEVPAAPGRMEK